MGRLNTIKTIESVKGRINTYYDMTIEDVENINKVSKDSYDLMAKSFRLGYAQGVKAQKKGRAFND